jgi:hypothetical protein
MMTPCTLLKGATSVGGSIGGNQVEQRGTALDELADEARAADCTASRATPGESIGRHDLDDTLTLLTKKS